MSDEPKDRQAFTDRDAEALGRLYGKPPPGKLMDKVMSKVSKEAPTKRNIAPESPQSPTPEKDREKER